MKKTFINKMAKILVASAVCVSLASCKEPVPQTIPQLPSTTPSVTGSLDNTKTPPPTLPLATPDKPTIQPATTTPAILFEQSPAIRITELMVKNTVGIKDNDGNYSSWIEIYNQSDKDVSLSEYTMVYGGKTYSLPTVSVKAGEYFVVFVNGKNTETSVGAFLTEKGEITIMHGEYITTVVNYTNTSVDKSFLTHNGSETGQPTPGYENIKEKDQLIISEIMSTNSIYPVGGADCDWIELINNGDHAVDLSDYYITKEIGNPYSCKLPSITLEKGQYVVLACGKDISFNLSKEGESVYITRNDGVLAASVSFGVMEKNTSWTFDKGVVSYPSPGYQNDEKGHLTAICSRQGLVISEVLSSNGKYSPFNGQYCDIVELYNNSSSPINLGEYYLSDKGSDLQRYKLPDVTLEAGGYYIVYCDSQVEGAAPFGISGDGETVYISRADGYLSDALAVPALSENISWGRKGMELLYFAKPTIGKVNGNGSSTMTLPPEASVSSGIYTESQKVTLSGDGTIYYTLDGSRPSNKSKKYTGETITVTKNTSIRAIAYNDTNIPSDPVVFNYFIDIPDYTLPIIKISVKDDEMFGENGIYTNYKSHDEIECNAAMYVDGKEEFSVNCGIKIFGAGSRMYTKKSFQLEFRSEYGVSRLEYPLFDDIDITSFNNIVLRSGSQGLMKSDAMITDEFVTSLARMGGQMPSILTQAYKPCNVYVNDEYYGVYFIREKIDEEFIGDHLGIDPNTVSIVRFPNSLEDGEYKGWNEIWEKIYEDKLDLTVEENYKLIADQINLESYIDVIIMRSYTGDHDYSNIRAFHSPEYDGGRWNFILYDNDLCLRSTYEVKRGLEIFLQFDVAAKDHALLRAMMKNEGFMKLFLQRLAHHLKTTLTMENAHARLDAIVSQVEHDMPYQIERWNDDSFYVPNMEKWRENLSNLYYWTGEDREKWFILDVAKTLNLTKDQIAEYMGEEFAKYL